MGRKPTGNPMGRPKKEINWEQFEALCRILCTQGEICSVININERTLCNAIKEHYGETYSEVYKKQTEYGKASLRRLQMRLAEKSAGMAIFLGKQYLGQKDDASVVVNNFTQLWSGKIGKSTAITSNGRIQNTGV